ncbi:MAG TPA: glycosyltransferase family 2 protein [Gemmatimonadaceae bacterium]|nr:glycosyltransferase family 2 protein [Gemmatimonadaceae bacterium]
MTTDGVSTASARPAGAAPRPRDGTAPPVSVMIFTYNEEIHLPSCLASVTWCDDVIVVDSFSTDATERIARDWGARFFQHPFAGFGSQRNWALDHTTPRYDWVLVLDADERVPPEMVAELRTALGGDVGTVGAFRVRRRFYMWGRWLRHSSLYPNWVVRLVHRDRVRYVDRGHAETQNVDGEIRPLATDLVDENLRGIDEWFARQNRYARKEAEYELAHEREPWRLGDLLSGDPLRRRALLKRVAWRLPGRPLAYFVYSYLARGGCRDGRDGLVFCAMKAVYQAMIVVKKYDARRAGRG